jgi:poly(3-hydroxybutyrate) depolymerase
MAYAMLGFCFQHIGEEWTAKIYIIPMAHLPSIRLNFGLMKKMNRAPYGCRHMQWILVFSLFFWLSLSLVPNEVKAQTPCMGERYSQAAIFETSDLDTISNVEFGVATQYFTGQNVSLLLDVFMPDTTIDPVGNRPLVVLIHGGGFMAGNKIEMHNECAGFAQRGYVAVSIGYRLGWNCDNVLCFNCYGSNLQKAMYHAAQDALAALRYIYQHAASWHADPNMLFLGGESAGSITALLAAHWTQETADAWLPAGYSEIAGNLHSSGNLWAEYPIIRGMINHCGAVPATAILNEQNPVPMISFHDSNDCVVPYGNGPLISCLCSGFLNFNGSSTIHAYSVANGLCSELHTVPQILPNHCQFPSNNLVELASCFMKRAMCGFCMSSQNSDIYAQAQCQGVATSSSIEGCTYQQAANYHPEATNDDGSCIFQSCLGDLNTDGIVGVSDLLIFIEAYGSTCNE